MDELLTAYAVYMQEKRGYSTNTVSSYLRDLRQFRTFLEAEGIDTMQFTRVTKTSVMAFTLSLRRAGKSSASISRAISAVRSFFGWLIANGHVRVNPAAELESPTVPKQRDANEALTTEQVSNLLAQTAGDTPLALRDRAMLEVLYGAGLHVSELIALNPADVDLHARVVRYGKNGRRMMPLGMPAAEALRQYMETGRLALAKDGQAECLFLNRGGEAMSRQGCWKMIRARAKAAGIEETVTPRLLRGSLAAHLVDNGADAVAVRELLGLTGAIPGTTGMAGLEMLRRAHPRNGQEVQA